MKEKKKDNASNSKTQVVIACVFYMACSIAMIFTSKAVLSVYGFQRPFLFVGYQNACAVILVLLSRRLGIVSFEDFQWNTARIWIPANVLFVGMLVTGSLSLSHLSVPMVTILKNVNTVAVTVCDWYFLGQDISMGIAAAMGLIILSSIATSITNIDSTSGGIGYFWMFVNIVFSTSYTVYLKTAMNRTEKLSKFGMVFYNNLLSLPLLFGISILIGDIQFALEFEFLGEIDFLLLLAFAGVMGLLISLSSLGVVRTTSPMTYSFVGSFNRVPMVILGFILFRNPVTANGLLSILLGLIGGMLYPYAKWMVQVKKDEALKRRELLDV